MPLITVAGSPSVGKTSVVLRIADRLREQGLKVGVVKLDSLSTTDDQLYAQTGLPVAVGLAGSICPDHYFFSNIEDRLARGQRQGLDLLVSESAGLCNRGSPHIEEVMAACVVDTLAGVHTPKKIGPMLRLANPGARAAPTPSLEGQRLRFPMPAAVCPYCVGETAIGEPHQRGNVKKMRFADQAETAS